VRYGRKVPHFNEAGTNRGRREGTAGVLGKHRERERERTRKRGERRQKHDDLFVVKLQVICFFDLA